VTVAGWPEPFATEGFQGGTNDINGVATATFQVPDVAPGTYTIQASCSGTVLLRAGSSSESAPGSTPNALGPYATTLPFTVLAAPAATPAVEAQPTTTG
jgi:hypothetical protein